MAALHFGVRPGHPGREGTANERYLRLESPTPYSSGSQRGAETDAVQAVHRRTFAVPWASCRADPPKDSQGFLSLTTFSMTYGLDGTVLFCKSKVRHYNDAYLKIGFTVIDGSASEPLPQCVVCYETLSNEAMKP